MDTFDNVEQEEFFEVTHSLLNKYLCYAQVQNGEKYYLFLKNCIQYMYSQGMLGWNVFIPSQNEFILVWNALILAWNEIIPRLKKQTFD